MDQASSTATSTTPSNLVHRSSAAPASNDGGSDGGGRSVQDPAANTAQLKEALTSTKYRHVAAVHSKSRPSTLSHDASETPSFIGFRNLGLIVLIAGNLRLVLENIQKYGVLICVKCHDFRRQDLQVGAVVFTLIPCSLVVAYMIEMWAAENARLARKRARRDSLRRAGLMPNREAASEDAAGENDKVDTSTDDGTASPTLDQQARFRRTWYMIVVAHLLNISFALVLTSWAVFYYVNHPLIGTVVEMHAIIVWLKTASYALTNRDLRHAFIHPHRGEAESIPALYSSCPYPTNVSFGNLCYFWWAPTLIYQPVYPRTDKIRWLFVAKRLGECAGLCVVMWVLSAQYAAPTLQNSLRAWHEHDIPGLAERVLKLSTVSLVIWLAGFFALFQSTLNALAEVTRFADRCFYDDWWNSVSLGEYWRMWNRPVSNYFRRHVFSPLMGRGWKFNSAAFVVFTLSAILHELAVGIPTHRLIGIAFLGMLVQIPLIAITRRFEKADSPGQKMVGNCLFWAVFTILGQPFAALCYFYSWQSKFGSISEKWASKRGT